MDPTERAGIGDSAPPKPGDEAAGPQACLGQAHLGAGPGAPGGGAWVGWSLRSKP